MSEPCTATNSITLAQGGEEVEFVCDRPRGHDLLPREDSHGFDRHHGRTGSIEVWWSP